MGGPCHATATSQDSSFSAFQSGKIAVMAPIRAEDAPVADNAWTLMSLSMHYKLSFPRNTPRSNEALIFSKRVMAYLGMPEAVRPRMQGIHIECDVTTYVQICQSSMYQWGRSLVAM